MVKQNSKVFLEENFLKRHETAVVDELDRGGPLLTLWGGLLFLHDVSLVQQQALALSCRPVNYTCYDVCNLG